MVRKKKTKKNSLNQYTVLWVSLVVLVLGIAVLYPFVKDGVVGQAYSG